MSAEETLAAWLLAHNPYTSLIVGGLHPSVIPRGNPLPASAYARTGTEPVLTIHGTKPAEFVSMEIQSWAPTATAAKAVGDAAEDALRANGEIPTNRRVAYDEESGNFGDVIEVRLLINF